MAEEAYIQWRNSATPIFKDEYAVSGSLGGDLDGTKSRKLVKTADGAQTIGGGETTASQSTIARIEGASTFTLTDSNQNLSDATGITAAKTLSFLGIQIIDANGNTSTTVNCMISLDNNTSYPIKLVGVGSSIAIPLVDINSNNIDIKSSASGNTCKIKICVQRSSD